MLSAVAPPAWLAELPAAGKALPLDLAHAEEAERQDRAGAVDRQRGLAVTPAPDGRHEDLIALGARQRLPLTAWLDERDGLGRDLQDAGPADRPDPAPEQHGRHAAREDHHGDPAARGRRARVAAGERQDEDGHKGAE